MSSLLPREQQGARAGQASVRLPGGASGRLWFEPYLRGGETFSVLVALGVSPVTTSCVRVQPVPLLTLSPVTHAFPQQRRTPGSTCPWTSSRPT